MIELGGRFWAWVPVGLLGSMLIGLGWMAFVASNDPGFALEPDYYQKAVRYDQEIEQRAENARLAWRFRVSAEKLGEGGNARVRVVAHRPEGRLTGATATVEALRNASAARVLTGRLEELRPGEYWVELPLKRGGLWEFRFRFERAKDRATHLARLDVFEAP